MQRTAKPRVVIDTNLIISAIIIAGSVPDQLLRAWQNNLYILIISNEELEEIKDVLQREKIKDKYHLSLEKISNLLTTLKLGAEVVNPVPEQNLPVHSRDPKDNKLLALALGGNADYLVTGDNDLLALYKNSKLGQLKIIKAKEFLSILTIA